MKLKLVSVIVLVGLSMNSENSTEDLLLAPCFLGRLYNFCNSAIIFYLMEVTMCRRSTCFLDSEMTEYYQKSAAKIASLQKLKAENL